MAKEVVVFLASPGDCEDEREVARAVAVSVTQAIGTSLGIRVRVEGWESVPPDFGRPQDQINPLVDECDIFLGLLGHRWGSPTGTHSSGFREEFDRAVQRRREGEAPHIAMYFRRPPAVMAADPGPELTKVLDFQRQIRNEHVLLYRSFHDPSDLERHLWPLISQLVIRFATQSDSSADEATNAGASREKPANVGLESDEMDDARRQIASTTDTVTQLVRGIPTGGSPDRDRLMLIALGLNNDGGLLPPHVANRLFLRRAELALSVMEAAVWLRSLLADVGRSLTTAGRVIPGYDILGLGESQILEFLDDENDEVVRGVFRLLLTLGARVDPLWTEQESDPSAHVDRWATALRRAGVTRDVETYLAALATPEDLPLLDQIHAAAEAPVVAQLRGVLAGDPSALATAVASEYYQPEWKATLLEKALSAAAKEAVELVATGKNTPSQLRVSAARELKARQGLSEEVLQRLIMSPELVDHVLEWASDSPPLLEHLANVAEGLDDKAPDHWDIRHRIQALSTTTEELLARFDHADDALSVWEMLEWKFNPVLVDRARQVFDSDAAAVVGPMLEYLVKAGREKLIPFLRGRCRRGALRILARQDPMPEEDLNRLRKEVERSSRPGMDESLLWLADRATADDVARLMSALPRVYGETSLRLVEAILRVGGHHAARELLQTVKGDQAVLAVRAVGQDPASPIGELHELLYSADPEVRIAAVEEIAKRDDNNVLQELLKVYPNTRGTYYYNVVCRLDWLLFSEGSLSSSGPSLA